MKNLNAPAMPIGEEETDRIDDGIKIYTGLTKREQACITLGIPETGDPELDALILKSERKRIAAMAMQGLQLKRYKSKANMAEDAVGIADALLEELAK